LYSQGRFLIFCLKPIWLILSQDKAWQAYMIIVRLRGGLGNQLFQYAAAYSLAVNKGVELKSDLYTYTKHAYRKYELSHFNVQLPEATRDEVHGFTGSNPVSRYLNKMNNYYNCPKVFAQPHYHFYEDFFSLPAPLYLSGYWQSEKYFLPVADHIRRTYTPATPLDSRNADLVAEMRSSNSVALHIRRGDYQSKGYEFFVPVNIDYYRRALSEIQSRVSNPRFFVFSDDIAWSREQLKDIQNTTFIDHNTGADSYKDMVVMSACRNQIIANSTFSWWGAWLNDFDKKIVIAPKTWFHYNYLTKKTPVYPCRYYSDRDLFPASWIRV